MRSQTAFAIILAETLGDCPWLEEEMQAALKQDLSWSASSDRIDALVSEILGLSPTPYAPSPQRLMKLIRGCPTLRQILEETDGNVPIEQLRIRWPQFWPLPVFANLDIPRFATTKELADWLGLTLRQLDWLAGRDYHVKPSNVTKFQHYTYTAHRKPSGRLRLIEAPKRRMKAIQRRILHEVLDAVPLHPAAHGFVKGRNVVSAAQIHAGEAMVIKMDLADFFPSIPDRRIQGIFRSLGYPWRVAYYLTGLVTAQTPPAVIKAIRFPYPPPENPGSFVSRSLRKAKNMMIAQPRPDFAERQMFFTPHLPQGAPTSPCLANLAAHRLDCRLAGLARRFDANYSRYADDMTFSGDKAFAKRHDKFVKVATVIIKDEGFLPRADKTRVMAASTRQEVTGITVNAHVNLPRKDFDALKATLHNCVRHGPAGQNRAGHPDFRAHLDGRINWAEQLNPRKAAKLRWLFNRIDWPRFKSDM